MDRLPSWLCCVSLAAVSLVSSASGATTDVAPAQLIARAVLPAATFAPGPTSGALLGSADTHGHTVPFHNRQPVQGFSGLVARSDGTFLGLCDNGFGALENSGDFALRVYRFRPHWESQDGGDGSIELLGFVELSDPAGHVPFPIVQAFDSRRGLTGADFDPESIQQAPDGTWWIGDEFGPYLLHTDTSGRLLEPPIPVPAFEREGAELRTPQHPSHATAARARARATLHWLTRHDAADSVRSDALALLREMRKAMQPSQPPAYNPAPLHPYRVPASGGFEAMALSPDGRSLYPILEKPLVGDAKSVRWILEFDVNTRRYTGARFAYVCEKRGTSVPDFILTAPTRGVVLERDSSQGTLDGLKAVYQVEFTQPGAPVKKRLLADLLAIEDPHALSSPGQPGDVGLGTSFAMPFLTIESLVALGSDTLAIINDNNFPFSVGRHLGTGHPDDNELIVIRVAPFAESTRD